MKIAKLALGLLLISAVSVSAAEPAPVAHPNWSFKEAGLIPVQSGGRVKPLDSLAREMILYETGSRKFEGWDPVDLFLSLIAYPKSWDEKAFIQINREDVRRQLGLDEKRTRFAPHELFNNFALAQYAEYSGKKGQVEPPSVSQGKPKADLREEELKRVLDRLGTLRLIVSGDVWLVVPKAAPAAWLSLAGTEPEGETIRSRFVTLLQSYMAGDEAAFNTASIAARHAVEVQVPNWTTSMERSIRAESFYNRTRPFLIAWILYATAALFWAFGIAGLEGRAAGTGGRFWSGMITFAKSLGATAFLVHVGGIAFRCYVAGRPPVTNMYESIMWVSLGVVVFAAILYAIQKQAVGLIVAFTLAAFGLIAGDAAPAMMDPGIHPLVPVLRSNYWLTIHVLTITLGYAAFALTLGIANVTLFHFLKQHWNGVKSGAAHVAATQKIAALNQLTYRAMQFGVVLLAAGTILGGIWADYSWGRFWGWDPKEVWALIALLSYLVILHGRFTGWVKQFAYAAWTVVAFLSVVMAWYGVNFILGVGLHSYGFSTGGRGWVAGFVGAQLAYVGFVTWIYWRAMSARAAGAKLQQA